MATFPAIEPHSRSYSLGGQPVAMSLDLAVLLGSEPVDLTLTLGWTSILPAVAAQITSHYQGQRGPTRPFALPVEAWRDHATVHEVLPVGQLWRYAPGAGPEPLPAGAGLVNLTVNFISYYE